MPMTSSIRRLAVVKHGLFQDAKGAMNYESKSRDGEGLNSSIFNGIEEHGWQDGIKFPFRPDHLLEADHRLLVQEPPPAHQGKQQEHRRRPKELAAKKILLAETDVRTFVQGG